jgi:hypothetical protein
MPSTDCTLYISPDLTGLSLEATPITEYLLTLSVLQAPPFHPESGIRALNQVGVSRTLHPRHPRHASLPPHHPSQRSLACEATIRSGGCQAPGLRCPTERPFSCTDATPALLRSHAAAWRWRAARPYPRPLPPGGEGARLAARARPRELLPGGTFAMYCICNTIVVGITIAIQSYYGESEQGITDKGE